MKVWPWSVERWIHAYVPLKLRSAERRALGARIVPSARTFRDHSRPQRSLRKVRGPHVNP